MKRYLLIALLALSAMMSYAYDACVDGIYYNLVPKAKQATVTIGDNQYIGDIVIPENITYEGIVYSVSCIESNTFGGDNISSIVIPNSITTIKDGAFEQCRSITSIVLPNSITCINRNVFRECSSLRSVIIPSSITTIKDGAFFQCNSLASVEIPNSVTIIEQSAFYQCNSLEKVVIPNAITTIESGTFADCMSLFSITIPNSVERINGSAFEGCRSLATIMIPNSVTTIGGYAFYNCGNLTNVTLGSGIQNIYSCAFANCSNLENVYSNAVNPPSAESSAFDNSYIDYANLYVPTESLSSYRNTAPWSSFGSILALTPANPEDVDLVDGEEYTSVIDKTCNTLTYTRNFPNTDWNALYVPFSMQYEDWKDGFEIARLNDVHQFDDDEDGEIDRTVLEVVKMKEGSATEPNTPYMIKAKETGEKTITLTDATLYATEENSFDVTSWSTRFTFTGTYRTVTDMATRGYYALANGGLKQATSDVATLGAFRWYLDITDRTGNPASLMAKKVFLSFDDGEITEIEMIEATAENNADAIYSVNGLNVEKNKVSLPKGMYVRNGKKIIVK